MFQSKKISKQQAAQARDAADAIMLAQGLDPNQVRFQQDLEYVLNNSKVIAESLKGKGSSINESND